MCMCAGEALDVWWNSSYPDNSHRETSFDRTCDMGEQRPRFRFLLHRNVKRTWRYQTCVLCYSSFEQALWLLGKFNGDFQCEMLRNFHRSVSSLLTIRSSLLTRPKDSRVLYFWNSPVKLNSSDNKVTKIKFSEHVQSTSHGCHYTFNPLTLKIWSLILSSCC